MAGDAPRPGRRKRARGGDDPLEPYRRIRKPVPPPEFVHPDRRGEIEDEEAEREMREAVRVPGDARSSSEVPPPGRRPIVFADRRAAGEMLGEALRDAVGADEDVVALAIPRGGVEVAAAVAHALAAPFDVVIPRKVGAPGNPELGIGAVAEGVRVLDGRLIEMLRVPSAYLAAEIARQEREITRRTAAYRGRRPAISVRGRTAIVIDDGVATGGTATAALRWARAAGAARVVFAVPVAPADAIRRLRSECDAVVCLSTPAAFTAVGQWYLEFPQVSDAEVVALLGGAPAGESEPPA